MNVRWRATVSMSTVVTRAVVKQQQKSRNLIGSFLVAVTINNANVCVGMTSFRGVSRRRLVRAPLTVQLNHVVRGRRRSTVRTRPRVDEHTAHILT